VLRSFARGDFSVRLPVASDGIDAEVADTLNTVIELNQRMAGELQRVSNVVGKEGRIGERFALPGAAGAWAQSIESVNGLITNLVHPTTEVGRVIGAVASGDLAQKMAVDIDGRPLKGEFLRTAKVVNGMVEQLSSFASEVTRVAREVGTEGKLGGQARVRGVAGTWKDLTDNVNLMAGNLTGQVRNIAEVTTAVAKGDLSKKITVDVKGEILELKNTINTMVDQLNAFASEVTRVAREVGTEGKLGGQAQVPDVGGTWKDLTDNVNSMASNLTAQVRNIADVTTAVAKGNLARKITVDVKGEILQLKNTINTMVDQLNGFASEVTRVAREVGTEGKLGGQAEVPGVAGTWKDLTDSVNSMASNLTNQVRNIADVTTAVASGDLSKKITVDVRGEILQLKNTINTMVDQLRAFAAEVTRVAREVGTEGKLGGQAQVEGVAGTWKDLTDSVNFMASNLTAQVRNIADVTTAVANGDLSWKITVDVKGEILQLKNTINTMVDQLNAFASEVTRVAREVGTEGRLGGQAFVKGVGGTWKDLTDSVNFMASNLTNQVRGIAQVVTAVANGDLKRKLALEARGEIAELAETINSMTDTLAIFADQVTTVAREVGVEGKLGGQAKVPGASGTWRDLTDNVNQLAGNLTTQVRAIGDVATAVTKGDLTRAVAVEAMGEVAALKDNINEMIRNLRETTQKTTEQDWLKTNLAKFTRMLQGQRDLFSVAQQILSELAPLVGAQHGVFYIAERDEDGEDNEIVMKLLASYAYQERKHISNRFRLREGLVGQCAFEKQKIHLVNVPANYVQISSGLGEAPPLSIVVLPVIFEDKVNAVIELASFARFSDIHQVFLDQLTESIGIVVNTIAASMRTESLLKQSQSLTQELQSQQEELRETNERLERQAATLKESEERLKTQQEKLQMTNEQLEDKAEQLEIKNREVEFAKSEIEEKAEQLALTSKYKSEFLANMSHELRTPLNSLLILSKMLSENPEGNLIPRQVEFAKTIHGAGTDLLVLISDILDLSKIESGTIAVEPTVVSFVELRDYVEQNFRHIAQQKSLEFRVELKEDLPPSVITDPKRLQQILKNLLSNAFKFTESGRVILEQKVARLGWSRDHEILNRADKVIAFSVVDTGIGIAPEKQKIIFEAFQQADGTTSRKYGGTGLGLSISREIARLLGGEIRVVSAPGMGSTFTLYLPRAFVLRSVAQPSIVETEGIDSDVLRAPEDHLDAPSSAEATAAFGEHDQIEPGDKVILLCEEDPVLAQGLMSSAREHGFKCVRAPDGTLLLDMVSRVKPSVIVFDLHLPDVDGWMVLDRLKHDPTSRHVPVELISTEDEHHRALRMGAAGFLQKPADAAVVDAAVDRLAKIAACTTKRLLLVEDDERERRSILALIGNHDVEVFPVGSAEEALDALRRDPFHCMVLDLGLPDMSGVELLRKIKGLSEHAELPIVVYTGRDLEAKENEEIAQLAKSIVIKDAASPERLFDETSLYLHRVESELPEPRQRMLASLHRSAPMLRTARVLVVDDDVRNIFAIASALERYEATVLYAENGQDGLAMLEHSPDIDVVLMDIMMPGMDGYEVIRRIRAQERFRSLPIIALTARAMRGDREKCIQAGASDYIAKPVDMDHLLSLLRVSLSNKRETPSSLSETRQQAE
jgi:signal transduction histidine kinase/HAMP domain-containing protein/CheY-like chemotaxis protein